MELQEDLRDLQARIALLETGEEETFPADVAPALIHRREPVRVLLTQPQLTGAAGISVLYLSQLESGKRRSSAQVLAKPASAQGGP